MRLTDIVIRALPVPAQGVKIYPDDQLTGFGVRVSQGGSKAFTLTLGTNRERVTIGRYPILSLADARTEAKRILAERTLSRFRPQRILFEEALNQFVSIHCAQKNRPGTAKIIESVLRKHFASLSRRKLGDITAHDISFITDRLLKAELPSAASHAFTYVRTMLRWCVRRRLLQHSPIEGLEPPTKPVSRERVLSDAELTKVVAAARLEGTYGTFLLMLAYTGQRRGETAALQANWINRAERTITFPKSATKNNRDHRFPYGSAVAALLETLPSEGLLFKARGSDKPLSGFSKLKADFDKQCSISAWTPHDLRRTFATGLQRLGVRLEVTEALLNHVSGTRSGIVGVYQRHGYMDEMRAAITLWEQHVASLLVASESPTAP